MIYPEFLQRGDTVGICAPSAGIGESDFAEFELSLSHLRRQNWTIKETASVRSGLDESASPKTRGAEFNELVYDSEAKAIMCAAGGDFLISMLPYVDAEAVKNNPKWIQGFSDPTSLLYYITTACDVATVYGVNAGGLGMQKLHPSLDYSIDVLKGILPVQHSFYMYESNRENREFGYALDERVEWETPCGDVDINGRLIGGCLDCICDIIGTKYDKTLDFIQRYKDDGIIWYFDIFAMKSEAVHNALFKMKDMGYFENARGFVFGRVCFPSSFTGISYIDAARKILGNAPMIFDADIGHVPPKMTLINGAMARIESYEGKGSIEMFLK